MHLEFTYDEAIISPIKEVILSCLSEEYIIEISGEIVEAYKEIGNSEKLYHYGEKYSYNQIKNLFSGIPYIIFTDFKVYNIAGDLEYTISVYDTALIDIYSSNEKFDSFLDLKNKEHFVLEWQT